MDLEPSHCTAAGKVLLHRRAAWRQAVLGAPLQAHTQHTITDPATLGDHLRTIGALGYATEREEFKPRRRGIAVPVTLAEDTVAALAVIGSGELDEASLYAHAHRVAQVIARGGGSDVDLDGVAVSS